MFTNDADLEESMLSLDSLPRPVQQPQSVEEDASTALEASTQIVRALFGSAVGECWGDYFCTHNRIRGRLYATSLAVLFHSNLLGFERRICLRYCEIVEMELFRTTSIRITMFDSEQYVLRSFNDRVQVLRMLKGLKILSDRRRIGGRRLHQQPQSLPNLSRQNSDTVIDNERPLPIRHQLVQSVPRPSSEGSSMSTQRSSVSSRRRLSSSSDNQHQPLVSNRRRAVSDSCTVTATGAAGVATTVAFQQPSTVHESPFLFTDNMVDRGSFYLDQDTNVPDDVSVDQSLVPSTVEEAWKAARDSIVSASDVIIGIESLELPVTLERFYQLFLADGAPYALDWYQEKYVGDRDIELTGWDVDTDEHVLKRSMTFTHPISNVVGPSQARTTRHQRLKRFEDFGILVENTTVIVDNIPSADAFYVHDNWVIQGSAVDPHSVTLTTRFAARFTKRALFRGLIEKSVVKETTKWFQGYAEMIQSNAQQALEATTGADECQRLASERPPPHIVQKPAIPTATDSNLPMIIDLLQRISASMNSALMVGGCAVVLLLCILAYQLVLMRSTVEIMKQELISLRIEIARYLPHEIHHDCKAA